MKKIGPGRITAFSIHQTNYKGDKHPIITEMSLIKNKKAVAGIYGVKMKAPITIKTDIPVKLGDEISLHFKATNTTNAKYKIIQERKRNFNCYIHNWSSEHEECPACLCVIDSSNVISTVRGPGAHTTSEYQYNILQLDEEGRMLLKCPDCLKKGIAEWKSDK